MLNTNKQSNNQNIALIGAGVSGNGALLEFSKTLKRGDTLTIFESSDEPFKGFAYQTSHIALEHLLLGPISTISTFDKHTETFANWLNKNKELVIGKIENQYSPNTSKVLLKNVLEELNKKSNYDDYYAPRIIYGYYMEAQAQNIITKMRENGVNVNIVKENVNSIKEKGGFAINDKLYSKVLVANGCVPNEIENQNHVYSKNIKDKIRDTVIKKGNDTKIKILGSQASAMDIVKSIEDVMIKLIEDGLISKNTKITLDLVSRDGMMQRIKTPTFNYDNKFLNKENFFPELEKNGGDFLKTMNTLFKKDLQALSEEQLDGITIDFDLFDFIKNSKNTNGLELMKADLQAFQTLEYKAKRTVFVNAMILIYEILENNSEKPEIKKLHSVLIANSGGIFHEYAKHIANELQNIELNIEKVEDVENVAYDLSLDSRTYSKANENNLNNDLITHKMVDKNGDSLVNNLVTLGGIQHASNRFADAAFENGINGVKCFETGQQKLRFYELKNETKVINLFDTKVEVVPNLQERPNSPTRPNSPIQNPTL
jgi:hypothetical protein